MSGNNIELSAAVNAFEFYTVSVIKRVLNGEVILSEQEKIELDELIKMQVSLHAMDGQFFADLLAATIEKLKLIGQEYGDSKKRVEAAGQLLKVAYTQILARQSNLQSGFNTRLRQLELSRVLKRYAGKDKVVDELQNAEIRLALYGKSATEINMLYQMACADLSDLQLCEALESAPKYLDLLTPEQIEKGRSIRLNKQYPFETLEIEILNERLEQMRLLVFRSLETLRNYGWLPTTDKIRQQDFWRKAVGEAA
ncbi:MAG: hypothetical protein C4522_08700 [Desulfobacteraceae bacterium]|nr:MAG: hypothetical protein C4522_08700 [Desulfobacteraceae bacterium]